MGYRRGLRPRDTCRVGESRCPAQGPSSVRRLREAPAAPTLHGQRKVHRDTGPREGPPAWPRPEGPDISAPIPICQPSWGFAGKALWGAENPSARLPLCIQILHSSQPLTSFFRGGGRAHGRVSAEPQKQLLPPADVGAEPCTPIPGDPVCLHPDLSTLVLRPLASTGCTHIHANTQMHAQAYTYMFAHVHTCMKAVHTYKRTWVIRGCAHTCIHVHAHASGECTCLYTIPVYHTHE